MRHLYNTRNLFLTFFLLCCTTISAYDFALDGIFYNIFSKTEKTVKVTHGNYNASYYGDITIPSTVTYSGTTYSVIGIEPETFWGNTTLTSITIPGSITTIENYAFYGCTALTSVTIPHSITTIGNAAFCGCTGLASITIPLGVTTIGDEAFAHCSSLKEIALPTSITSIGEKAFKHCTALEEITIPQGVTTIGASMSEFCTALESITMPQEITTIGNEAFLGCAALESITIPSETTNIGTSAFDGCTSLKEIHIPEKVTSIGNNAFNTCTGLNKITVASGNTTYDSRNECNAIIESATNKLIQGCNTTIIPDGINCIYDWAFYNCDNLTSAIIPEGTTSIGDWAFYNCNALTGVELPNSTENIGIGSFYDCEELKAIYSQAEKPAIINYYTFEGLYDITTLYIPANTKELYSSCDYWRNFTNIIELQEGTRCDANNDGCVDIADITATTAMIIYPQTATPAGDIDHNGIVDTEDVAKIIETIQTTTAQTTSPTISTTVEIDGEGNTLLINIINPQYSFSAIQFDLHLPAGIEVEKENDTCSILLGSRARESHTTPEYSLQPDGAIRVIIHSTANENFSNTSGDIAKIALKAEGIADNSYPFELKNIKISSNGTKEELYDHTGYIKITNGAVGISTIMESIKNNGSETIYDLSGRKINRTIKGGIYIKGGKKHIAQ